MSSTEN